MRVSAPRLGKKRWGKRFLKTVIAELRNQGSEGPPHRTPDFLAQTNDVYPARAEAGESAGTGTAADSVIVPCAESSLRMARTDSTATGKANCSPRNPSTKRPPRISPRSS